MKLTQAVSAILCITTLTFSALAGTPEETAKKSVITVNLQDSPPAEALEHIGQLSGVKVHYTPAKGEPSTRITIRLKDVPASEVFTYVANLSNLTITYKDDGAHFAPRE